MAFATPVPTRTPFSKISTFANGSAVPVTTTTPGFTWLGVRLLMVGATVLESTAMLAGALIAMTTVPLGITLKLFLASGLSHFLLRTVGAARRPYEATFRVFAYAGVTSLLALIPGLGAPLAMAMTLLVVLLGIRVAHRATPGQSFLGAAPHFVALLLEAGV